jgi:3-oxoacyl-[acyl-carrier protein] reductase
MNTPTIPPLKSRVCLVTGATGTFGRALAFRLHQDGAGLLLTARSQAALTALAENLALKSAGQGRIETIAADLTEKTGFDSVVAAARTAEVSVLFNNAAIQGPIGPLATTDWDDWQAAIQVNLLVPAALCRALIPSLSGKPDGKRSKIINLSGGGATTARPNFSAYAAAKTALVRFTEILAVETASSNIDVNSVAPGTMASTMTQQIADAGADQAGASETAAAEAQLREGAGPSERATALCSWLASSASDGISGRLLAALWDPWPEFDTYRTALAASDIYTLRRIVPSDRGLNWPGGT